VLRVLAGFGRRDVVEHLLQCGANVLARDDGGLIPLHNACSFGHADVVQLLLQHGADANARDNWNYTPLHEAAIKGKIDVCIGTLCILLVFICGKVAKIRVIDFNDNSALGCFCVKLLTYLCYFDMCLVLLQRGADPSIRNTDGKTALDLADPLSKSVLTGTVMFS